MWTEILAGIIQGIFEWLPVSSEGIVALFSQYFFKEVNPLDFAIFLHLGTILAVLVYFFKDWLKVLTFQNKKLLKFLILTTIISLIVGYPCYNIVRNAALGNFLLLITGLGLLATAYFHKSKRNFRLKSKWLVPLAGFLQGLAVIPGFSRSGATIFALSLGKLNPKQILKLSFMMSVPLVLVSSIYLFIKNPVLVSSSWLATLFSFLTGLATLHFLLKIAAKINFYKFSLIFALICLGGAFIGFLV